MTGHCGALGRARGSRSTVLVVLGLTLSATSLGWSMQPPPASGATSSSIRANGRISGNALASAAVVVKQVPTAPRLVTATPGNASATVQWTEAVRAGVAPIAGYVVTPYLGTKPHKRLVIDTSGTSGVVSGLKDGVSFGFTVAAENAAGVGPQSDESNVVTIGAPDSPTDVRATMLAPGDLDVAFAAPANNGAAITGYVARCTPSNGGIAKVGTGGVSPVEVGGLTATKAYACTVTANNSRGNGPSSTPSTSTITAPAGVHAAPSVGAVIVSWTQLSPTGVTYVVSSSPPGKSCHIVDAASCTISVTDSTPWRFSVTASDNSGSSPPSSFTQVLPHRVVLIVAGQSNAVGAGSYAYDPTTFTYYFAPPYTNGADSLSNITWIASSHGGLLAAPENGLVPLDTAQMLDTTTPVQVFGPEIGLARQIWTDTHQPVTIVKAAIGSTSLDVDWNPARPNGDYAQMVDLVIATMSADAARGQLDTIGAFYWYQGEDDAANPSWYPKYQSNLANFISHLRTDLPMNATTPIALAKESLAANLSFRQDTGDCPFDNCAVVQAGDTAVRAADDWATANLAHVVDVDTLGLPRTAPVVIHLSNIGELTLGAELAAATEHLFP
ncbi:MAG: sialate O-acetylesterase [Acidimicrobiia bacterium]